MFHGSDVQLDAGAGPWGKPKRSGRARGDEGEGPERGGKAGGEARPSAGEADSTRRNSRAMPRRWAAGHHFAFARIRAEPRRGPPTRLSCAPWQGCPGLRSALGSRCTGLKVRSEACSASSVKRGALHQPGPRATPLLTEASATTPRALHAVAAIHTPRPPGTIVASAASAGRKASAQWARLLRCIALAQPATSQWHLGQGASTISGRKHVRGEQKRREDHGSFQEDDRP